MTKMHCLSRTVMVLLMSTMSQALWPAFPSDMGAGVTEQNSTTREPFKARSQTGKLLQSGEFVPGDVIRPCTCVREIRTIDKKCRENEAKLEGLKNEMGAMVDVVGTWKQSVGTISEGGTSGQNYNIAFSARVGYNRPYLGETQIIVFDELVINNGDVYDPYSGKFMSPIPGLYHFETTILSGFNATIETMLVLNGNEVARVFSGGFNNRGSGSNSVLLNMVPGDEVWVSVFFGNGDYVHGLWSTFSGYLVHSFK